MTSDPAAKALPFDLIGRRIFVAGHRGMVGAALMRRLKSERCEVLTADRRTLDLARQADTHEWLADNRPDVVIVAAARVGGIAYNNAFPVDFLADNLAIELNLIRGWRPSRCAKTCCSPARSSRPTNGTRSPRSPASSWSRPIAGNTVPISFR